MGNFGQGFAWHYAVANSELKRWCAHGRELPVNHNSIVKQPKGGHINRNDMAQIAVGLEGGV